MTKQPSAFVYTEVQASIPFTEAVWRDLNPVLCAQPGLLSRTWLSGHGNHSVGGLYAFDSLANAQHVALEFFLAAARQANAAFTARVLDAAAVVDACRDMASPCFA